jgi:hypothetical protein
MNEATANATERTENKPMRRTTWVLLWMGPLLAFAGAVSYFLYFARFPVLRDFPWVNLPVVVLGLLVSVWAGWQAFFDRASGLGARIFAGIALLMSLGISTLFGAYIFLLSNQLPGIDPVVRVGQAAPDFALVDQKGQTIRLSELRGRPVVLDFYRGHW